MVHVHLLLNLSLLLLRQLCNIQFIPKCPCHGHMSPGCKRRHPPHNVVGTGAHMSPHGTQRIQKGRSLLNRQPLHRIRIIGTPDLRAVIQHSRVKTGAAAGTIFQKQFRKFPGQPLLQFIHPQHIPMEQLPLTLPPQAGASHIRHLPVHIPFHIGYGCAPQNPGHRLIHIVHHLRPGQIQHILGTALHRLPPRNLNGPVRPGTVQLRIRRHHLRLKPDAEFHPQSPHLLRQIRKASRQLLLIDLPVPQGALVNIPVSKPAVVHDQHLNAPLLRLPGNRQQLLRIKIKIGGFPVVDENRPFPVKIRAADQMSPVQVMENTAHFPQPLIRVNTHHLRRHKGLPRL